MANIAEMLEGEPDRDERLRLERACRAQIRLIFQEVLADRWSLVWSLWQVAVQESEWFAVGVWAGLPNTVKQKLRELEQEHAHESRYERNGDRGSPDAAGEK